MSISEAKLCSACSGLDLQRSDFDRPPFEPEDRYNSIALKGSLGFLRKNRELCLLCGLIEHTLCKNEESLGMFSDDTEWEMIWRQVNDEYDPVTNEAEHFYGSGLYAQLRTEGSYKDHCIQLVDEVSTDGFLRARLIPESIDANQVRGWVRRCTEKHGEGCVANHLHIESHPAADTEFMVIDVHAKRLVNLPPGESYVALSYVWGHSNQITTSKSLLSGFQEVGALNINMSRTIRDAIDLTCNLDFRYLWVDSLCIVQDDDETKGPLIAKMDAVYGHAALTIVAASGSNVEAGLQGWKSSPPERRFLAENIVPGLRLGVLPFFDRAIMRSPHAQRGWTYQEGCLSPRCLVILEGKAFFSCRAAVWREDVNAEVDNVIPLEGANTLGRTPSEWPLRRYAQHVGAYTMRQLTYQSDALNAFAGIGRALAASMARTRMFHGLPAVVFDWAVLWAGSPMLGNLKRRDGFPSWAWAAWQGDILMTPDHFSSFDQKWLLERTWIEWYLATEEGEVILIWDPERDQTAVSPLYTVTSDQSLKYLNRASIESQKLGETNRGSNKGFDEEWKEPENSDRHDGDGNQESEGVDIDESDYEDDEDNEACPTYGSPTQNNPYGRNVQPKLRSLLPPRPISNNAITYLHLHYQTLHPGTLVFDTIIAKFSLNEVITTLGTTPATAIHSSRFCPLQDTANRVCGFIWDDRASQHGKNTESAATTFATAIPDVSPPTIPSSSQPPPPLQSREIFLLSQAAPGMLQSLKSITTATAVGGKGLANEYRLCETIEESMHAATAAADRAAAPEEETKEETRKMTEERGKLEVGGEYILGEWHAWEFFNVMLVQRVENKGATANVSEGIDIYERVGIGLLHCRALAYAFEPGPQWRTIGLR